MNRTQDIIFGSSWYFSVQSDGKHKHDIQLATRHVQWQIQFQITELSGTCYLKSYRGLQVLLSSNSNVHEDIQPRGNSLPDNGADD
jgi:hypothetical protein